MKIDVGILVPNLLETPNVARAAEDIGFDCLWTSETQHEPFLPLAIACIAARVCPALACGTVASSR